jgi:hypothetical protein
MVLDGQRARLMWPDGPVVVAQSNVPTESTRPLGEQLPVGQTDQLTSQLTTGNGEAQFRPNASRLTGSQRYAWEAGTQSLFST